VWKSPWSRAVCELDNPHPDQRDNETDEKSRYGGKSRRSVVNQTLKELHGNPILLGCSSSGNKAKTDA